MRRLSPGCWRNLVLLAALVLAPAAQAGVEGNTLNFAVTRNGDRIGTTTVRLQRDGRHLVAEIGTQIHVKIAGITVYRFEQRETERWLDGKLVWLNAVTNDNGTINRVSAARNGDKLSVNADGKVSQIDAAIVPASLWNAQLVQKTMALNSRDGSIMPISVIDYGKERLVLQGRPTTAHHYSIKTNQPHEVWYGEDYRLLKVELRGSDGSKILYQPG
jgi:hypothetical protein